MTSAAEGTLHTIISYGNHEVVLEPGTSMVTLENVQPTDEIVLKTILQSGEEMVEYVAPMQVYPVSDLMVKLEMSNWSVIDFSSEQSNEGPAIYAIDGQLSTYWHTQWSPTQPVYPHYITVDMKENLSISGIAIARRQGNANIASRFLLEVSADGSDWKSAGKFTVNNLVDGLQIVRLESPVTGRYFKLTGEASATNNTYMCIGEINLFR